MAMGNSVELPPEVAEQVRLIGAFVRLSGSLWISQTLNAADELRIADAIGDDARSADALARTIDADPASLERLLRALVTLGLCSHAADSYSLTSLGALLRSGTRDSLRDSVELFAGPGARERWGRLAECVRAGVPIWKLDGFDDPFAAVADQPDARASFDRAMLEGTRQTAGAVVLAYDFTGVSSIVDVGGGYGALLPPILRTYPEMTGIVFDRHFCRDGATRVFEKTRIADRCRFVDGDFFNDPLPPGADAYVIKSVIHDWDDDSSIAILRACRAAMRNDSRLLVVEVVVPDELEPIEDHQGIASGDLTMLLATGGRERTESEYRALLDAAGMKITRIVPTVASMDVVEASPT